MNENIKAFMRKVAADEGMQAKMKAFTDMDDAYAYASTIQDGFTREEFAEVMTKLSKTVNDGGELTDEDLANVAGGALLSEFKDPKNKKLAAAGGI